MSYFAIGVDLGGTNLRIAAVEETGRIMETITTGTEVSRGRDKVIAEMCEAIRTLSRKFLDTGTLMGVGIGVPGIIDMSTGMLRESPNLPGWHDYPVREEIERRLHSRVILENDANAAALGEFWMGAARDVDDMCMFTLGTGVGGGIVLNGRIWHGMTGMAGELGHITFVPNGAQCGCGNKGCLEQYASATAIKRMAMEAVAGGKAPELTKAMKQNVELTSQHIFQLAMSGDKPAKQVFERVGEALGTAVAGFINALNLPMYVIGGGVSSGWDAFAPSMMATVRRASFVYQATSDSDKKTKSGRTTVITRARLGGDAGLLGAARLPMMAEH
jgi:glucokinase